jgi:hypothetical protein
MLVVLVVVMFFFAQVQGLLRYAVPEEIAYRCQTLASDIQRFPNLLQKQHAELSALHICKPGSKMWFWQSIDERPLIELEQSVIQSIRFRLLEIIVVSTILAVICKRTQLLNKLKFQWRVIRRKTFLIALVVIASFYTLTYDLRMFLKKYGAYSLLTSPVFLPFTLLLHDDPCSTSTLFLQAFAISLVVCYWFYFMVHFFLQRGYLFEDDAHAAHPWGNLLNGQEEELQNVSNDVGLACVAFFAA